MYDKNNIFARIISGRLPCKKIYEDDFLIAVKDKNPAAPIHILVIPKDSYIDLEDFTMNAESEEISHYFKKVSEIAKTTGASEYRIISNKGEKAGQSVFHFHTHILSNFKNLDLIR